TAASLPRRCSNRSRDTRSSASASRRGRACPFLRTSCRSDERGRARGGAALRRGARVLLESGRSPRGNAPAEATRPLPGRALASTSPHGIALSETLRGLLEAELRGDASVIVRDVAYRSDAVTRGALFFCVPGAR